MTDNRIDEVATALYETDTAGRHHRDAPAFAFADGETRTRYRAMAFAAVAVLDTEADLVLTDRCPACNAVGTNPIGVARTTATPFSVLSCATSGCPVRTFHAVEADPAACDA
jgi:hypothetical protein